MDTTHAKRSYNDEEKRQLIANLDIEVAHRTRQFEAWLTDRLENFQIHQEGQVSRIPKQVRSMTMREFGEKYEGNVQVALRGVQKERLAAAGGDSSFGEIDKQMRKRKLEANQAHEAEGSGLGQASKEESIRATKNARMVPSNSPKKVAGSSTGPGTAQRARLLATVQKTPGTSRTMGRIASSPSPQKLRAPFNASTSYNPRPPSRPVSPVKHPISKPSAHHQRVPSSSSFNPSLPPKTPAYPSDHGGEQTLRLPRRDENMLSVNGSPLANPYEFGLGWFKGVEMANLGDDDSDAPDGDEPHPTQAGAQRTLKRSKSSIIIRRDPSVALTSGYHSRTDSQASFYTASSQTASSTHSRDTSHSGLSFAPQLLAQPSAFRFPPQPPADRQLYPEATPRPLPKHTRSFSAMVAIPTKDGHVIEFDPLQTSPGALDALEGITDSAKKQARVEMGRLVQAAVDKWKIG